MKKVFGDLVIDFIEGLEKIAIEKAITFAVTGSLGGGSAGGGVAGAAEGGIASLVFGGIGKLLGGVLGFDQGTNYVTQSGLAVIHQGESIVPAAEGSGPYTGGGGVQNISLNLSAFNPSGMQQLINQMMPQLARSLNNYQQLNPSTG